MNLLREVTFGVGVCGIVSKGVPLIVEPQEAKRRCRKEWYPQRRWYIIDSQPSKLAKRLVHRRVFSSHGVQEEGTIVLPHELVEVASPT